MQKYCNVGILSVCLIIQTNIKRCNSPRSGHISNLVMP